MHDTVAQKSYDPVLPPMPDDIDDEEDSVKIIRLVKNREPLVRLVCISSSDMSISHREPNQMSLEYLYFSLRYASSGSLHLTSKWDVCIQRI